MAGEFTMEKIFRAIEDSKKEVLSNLQGIEKKVNQLDIAMTNLAEQYVEMQQRVSKAEDDVADALKRTKILEKNMASLQSKVDYMENKSRQSNLLIVGVPEGSEGADTVAFLRCLFPDLFRRENFPEPLALERSHRIAVRNRIDPQKQSRPIIVKFLNYQDKMKILRLSREQRELRFNGKRIYLFPDLSEAVQSKRRAFLPVKKKLQNLGIRYAMFFPATLSIDHGGTKLRFVSPSEAENFVNEIQASEPSSPMH